MSEQKKPPIGTGPIRCQWMLDVNKVDTVQARAQIEALRAIAEELHELNRWLSNDAEPVLERVLNRVRWEA